MAGMTMVWIRLAPVILVLAITGCTPTRGQTFTSVEWVGTSKHLGKVMIVSPRIRASRDIEQVTGKIEKSLAAALHALPETRVVESQALSEALGHPTTSRPLSDYELVMAARGLDVDTVCLLTIGEYFAVGLPPWSSETVVLYEMRLIDVRSGKLLLQAVRERGYFSVKTVHDFPAELAEDLESVLGQLSPIWLVSTDQ